MTFENEYPYQVLNDLSIPELGELQYSVIDKITSFSLSLTSDMVSEIRFSVEDPYFEMHNANYFFVGRYIKAVGQEWEIASVEASLGQRTTVNVTARLKATQKMRRDKGQKNFGAISPSKFAAQQAARFGLQFFGEDSDVDGSIIRESTDDNEESTFDVLRRLANKLDFNFFESKGTLFFASQKFIADNQPSFIIYVPSLNGDPFFAHSLRCSKSSDSKSGPKFSAELSANLSAFSVFPGSTCKIAGLGEAFDPSVFMIERVEFRAGRQNLVSISGTDVVDPDEMFCRIQSFKQGDQGACVKRIQQAIGTTADGSWGPVTQRMVLRFQTANNLPADGIWDADDWAMLENPNYKRPSAAWAPGSGSDLDALLRPNPIFPEPKKVNLHAGWAYVQTNLQMPQYPYNHGNWNPDNETGYEAVVQAMNSWGKWLRNAQGAAVAGLEIPLPAVITEAVEVW